MTPDSNFFGWLALSDATPDAWAPAPWTQAGTGGTAEIDPEAGELVIDTTGDTLWYYRRLFDGDTARTRRVGVEVDVQAPLRIDVDSGGHGIGIIISDGVRMLGFVVNATVSLASPVSGLIATLEATAPFYQGAVLRVQKLGSAGFRVFVNERLIRVVPYHYAVPVNATFATPGVAWGHFSGSVSNERSAWASIEVAVNGSVAPAWKVRRIAETIPAGIGTRWNATHEALTRAMVGGQQTAQDMMTIAASEGFTDARRVTYEAEGSGDALPGDGNNLEVEGLVGALSIVRERIRIASESSGADDGVKGTWGATLNTSSVTAYRVRATCIVRAINATGATNQYVGPYLEVREGYKIRAALRYDSDGYFWSLVRPSDNTNVGLSWRLNPFVAHVVELAVLGTDRVMLIIDDHVVTEAAYSNWVDAGNTTSAHAGAVAVRRAATMQCEMDIAEIAIARSDSDLGRRPMLLQRAAERLIAFGGCERNDRLALWVQHRHGVLQLRGTDRGIRVELARIACSEVISSESVTPFAWYLGISFPSVTPVWLNVDGTKLETAYFVTTDAPGMTVQDICDWAAEHLLPTSTVESPFVCGIWFLTTSSWSASGLDWTASFDDTSETLAAVPVGKRIEVRKPTGADPVFVRVTAVGSGTLTVRGADLTGYGTGSYIISVLATA